MREPIEQLERGLLRGQARLEEWLNSASHGIGAALSVAGMVILIVLASLALDPWKIVGVSIYGTSLTLLYLVSTLYHATRRPRARYILRQLDHCAIFLLIAGTYTPFLLVNMRGATGWTMFAIVWSLAAVGIFAKLVWPERFHLLRVLVYLLMGWLMCLFPAEMAAKLSATGRWLLLAGGLTYTAGVVFYALDRIPFNHAIWHLFVIGGSVCHFFAIYFAVLPYAYP
ncbi:PAQR family membrane homeostasis protein TrhA [Halotalea alkalilenta]|uniref:Hemolysin III n=1 Tax=Halotalea alkalilenta TaxID=376489 RepID=A0A172YC34_9GAMM|nr:hemolysin III family protein [Halotalea alkalilenta]ANF56676.1 hemolysin III [Halotalea alkalilenta]